MLMYANVCTVCSNVVVAMDGSDGVRKYVNVCKCMHSVQQRGGGHGRDGVRKYVNVCKCMHSVQQRGGGHGRVGQRERVG